MSLAIYISLGLAVTFALAMTVSFLAALALDLLCTRFRDASDDLRQVGSNQTFHEGALQHDR